ncbi:MAG TPA: helix-turn-helix domain-containing protein, partial [Ktedonobacterales bacterium]|nr:helix-turn-helix domain-containing protein [Ktedonobacterales bacterium]
MATITPLAFGTLLKRHRRAARLTQAELAERAGFSISYISMLERGERLAQPATVELLAEALTLNADERAGLVAANRQHAANAVAQASDPLPAPAGDHDSDADHHGPTGDDMAEGAAVHTFLIADVRGYTRYTVEHGDEAAARLAQRFATLVRATVGPLGGRLIELRGDEALVAFVSARQALRAAVALQAHFGEQTPPLPVGIGLDAGEAVPLEGGYRGTAL